MQQPALFLTVRHAWSFVRSSSRVSLFACRYFPVRMELKTANGFAFVEFEEEVDARDAIKYMDGSVMCERRIAVRPCGPSRAVREQPRGPPPPGPYPERGYPERGPDRGYGGASERGYGGPPERDYPDRGAPLPPPSGDRFSGPPPPMRGPAGVAYGYRVEVENLSARTSWQDLKDFGRQAGGSIKYADVFNGEQGKTGYGRDETRANRPRTDD